jgi:hypothetical protein
MLGGLQEDVGIFLCSFIGVQVNSNIKPKKKEKMRLIKINSRVRMQGRTLRMSLALKP